MGVHLGLGFNNYTVASGASFTTQPQISGLTDIGDGLFVARIGDTLTATPGTVSGGTSNVFHWLINGTSITTGTTWVVDGAYDEDFVSMRQENNGANATTAAFMVQYTPPVRTAAPAPAVGPYPVASGIYRTSLAGLFTGELTEWTISGPTGISIDGPALELVVNTGTTGLLTDQVVSFYPSNSGGSGTPVTVTVSVAVAADAVILDLTDAGDGYLEKTFTAGEFYNGGISSKLCISARFYWDGSAWVDGAIVSASRNSAGAVIELTGTQARVTLTSGSVLQTTALPNPTVAGFYQCTMWLISNQVQYMRDGSAVQVSSASTSTNLNAVQAAITRITIGATKINTTVSNRFRHKVCGLWFGLATAAQAQAMHAWLWNAGGTPRDWLSFDHPGNGSTSYAKLKQSMPVDKALDVADAGLQDVVGLIPAGSGTFLPLTGWTKTGVVEWATPANPVMIGGAVGVISAPTIADAPNNNKLTLTVTLSPPSLTWTSPVATVAKLDVWSERGPGGHLAPASATVTNVTGNVATVEVTLARPVYAGEPVYVETQPGWLSDATGNTTGVVSRQAVSNLSAVAWPANWTGFSLRRIARSWTNAVPAQFPRGIGDVVQVQAGLGPLTSVYPVLANGTPQSHVRHGQMLNPTRGYANHPQSFIRNAGLITSFDAALEAPTNITLVDGDMLVCTRSNLDKYSNGGTSVGPKPVYIQHAVAVECVAALPGANQLPLQIIAPAIGFSKPARSTFDETALTFPDNAYTGVTWPDPDVILGHLKVFDLGTLMFGDSIYKRQLTPSGLTDIDGYGQVKEPILGIAVAMLSGPTATIPVAKKREIARALYFRGEQKWATFKTTGKGLLTDGAQSWGETADVVLYLVWSGQTSEWPNLAAVLGGNMMKAFFLLTADHITAFNTPHTNTATNAPQFNRANTIASVISPTQFTLAFSPYTKDVYTGNMMYMCPGLAAGGEGRRVTSFTGGVITIESAFTVTPSVGDLCSWRSQHTQTVGSADWNQKGATELPFVGSSWQGYSPAAAAEYRVQVSTYGELFGLSALGCRPSVLEPAWQYMLLAQQVGQPLVSNDFPTVTEAYLGFAVELALYTNHHASMVAVSQTVG